MFYFTCDRSLRTGTGQTIERTDKPGATLNAPFFVGRSMNHIGVGDAGRGSTCPLSKKSGKIFFGQLSCKIREFSGKNILPPKVDWAPTPMGMIHKSCYTIIHVYYAVTSNTFERQLRQNHIGLRTFHGFSFLNTGRITQRSGNLGTACC